MPMDSLTLVISRVWHWLYVIDLPILNTGTRLGSGLPFGDMPFLQFYQLYIDNNTVIRKLEHTRKPKIPGNILVILRRSSCATDVMAAKTSALMLNLPPEKSELRL